MNERASRVGLMGGTFDPLHIGHLIAASEVLHALALDTVVFVPAGRPWQKREFSDPEDRFVMTSLGAAEHRSFSVSRIELDRRGPTYTVETLEAMHGFYGSETSFFFIAGTDAMAQLETWHRFPELRDLVEMIVVPRPGWDGASLKPTGAWPELHTVEIPRVDISSSEIRARVAAGRPIDLLVPAPVARYIRAEGLYSSGEQLVDA